MQLLSKRRWLRFSVRTLLVGVTIACVWLAWQVAILRERQRLIDGVKEVGVAISLAQHCGDWDEPSTYAAYRNGPSWFRRWIGDEAFWIIFLPEPELQRESIEATRERMRSIGRPYRDAFPEASVGWSIGFNFYAFDELDRSFHEWPEFTFPHAKRDRSSAAISRERAQMP